MTDRDPRTLHEAQGMSPAEITELREKAERLADEQPPPDYDWTGSGECCASGSCEVCDPVRHR